MYRAVGVILAACLAPFLRAQSYIGAGGCSSSNCHGGTVTASEQVSRIWGNEYAIWSLNDKHAKAWRVLDEPRSKRMAEILKVADARTDKRCTVCHAAGSPQKLVSDGVACEACHGAAEKWLGPHTQKNSHAASIASGMTDTKSLRVRATLCLDCHLGSADKVVDHEMIAAGHPDLNFELDTFTAAQPGHFREVKPSAGDSLPRVRVWAVGQVAALAQGMRTLADRASRGWPEFAELECYQCHHDLRLESKRIERGYGARKPGTLQMNRARVEVARELVAKSAPDQSAALDGALAKVAALVAGNASGAEIAAVARQAATIADSLATRFDKQDFTAAQAQAMAQALAAAVGHIAEGGVHAAEVATMSLDSLSAAVSGTPTQPATIPLYDYLEHPSNYDPGEFAVLFRKAAGALK